MIAHIVESNLSAGQGQQRAQVFECLQEIVIGYIGIHQKIFRSQLVPTDGEISFDGRENTFYIDRKHRIVQHLTDGRILAKDAVEFLTFDMTARPSQGITFKIIQVFTADRLDNLIHCIEEGLNLRILDEGFGIHHDLALLKIGRNEVFDIFQTDIGRKAHTEWSGPFIWNNTQIQHRCHIVSFGFHLRKLRQTGKALSFFLTHHGEQGTFHTGGIALGRLEKQESTVVERTERTAHLCPTASAFFTQRIGNGFLFQCFEQGFYLAFIRYLRKDSQSFGMRRSKKIYLILERQARFRWLVNNAFCQLGRFALQATLQEGFQFLHDYLSSLSVESGFLRHIVQFQGYYHGSILRKSMGIFGLRATGCQ